MTARVRGADVVARTLARAGVRRIFSLSGNHIMTLYDAALDARLPIVHVRHEGAAVHMADAWGRLTGEPGIAMVTGGPGHANAVGALYTALAAESPMVLISGHAPTDQIGMGAFQEMRQADVAAPLVKASLTAGSVKSLGADIARALRIAASGRPGPVHLSLPNDLIDARLDDAEATMPAASDWAAERTTPDPAAIARMRQTLGEARRPLILAGPLFGTGHTRALCERLREALDVPVVCMESPRGVNDPCLGAFGEVLAKADLVLLLGKPLDFTTRFGQAPAFAADCRFLAIDADPDTLARTARNLRGAGRPLDSAQGEPRALAQALIDAAGARDGARHRGWCDEVAAAIAFRPPQWAAINTGAAGDSGAAGDTSAAGPLHPVEVGRAVQALIDRASEAVLVADGGEFGQWAQACVRAPERLINGPAGSIGSAIPMAIAAKIARPAATVVAMLGDGTFGFHMAEFDTAQRAQAPFVAVVGNDACWNAEYQIQLRAYGVERAVGCELLPARYDAVAQALGGHGEAVASAQELAPALERAVRSGKPACVNVALARIAAPTVSRAATAAGGGAH